MKTEEASGVVPITARLPYEVHRKLRFLAADSGVSMNTMLIKLLTAAMADKRVSVPAELLNH